MCFFGVYRKGLSILTVFAFLQTLSISQTDGERKHKNKDKQMFLLSAGRPSEAGNTARFPCPQSKEVEPFRFHTWSDKAQACQASV